MANTTAEVRRLLATLEPFADPRRAAGERAYLKSDLSFMGVPVPDLRRSVRAWLRHHPGLDRTGLTGLVASLWRRRLHEARALAVILLEERAGLLQADDLPLLESCLRRSGTWAYVDGIAIHAVGPLVEREPRLSRTLDRWARDADFWIRRSALLALLLPLRHGEGDWERFVRYADGMLDEREFFIRKALGWVLREHGKKRPARVEAFVRERRGRLSGVTLREAVRYLPGTRI